MENQPIVLERTFSVPNSNVWSALTDKDEMKKWYFDLEDFKAEVGFKFQFTGCSDAGVDYLHHCEVTEVIPGKKLTYSWLYDGYDGISYVSFELFDLGEKTLLKLTHSGLESFPRDIKDFARFNFVDGWNQIIHDSLRKYLEAE